MKHLFHRLSKLAQIVVPVVFLAIFAGFPPLWAGVSALLVLDFAAIMWVGDDDSQGGGRRERMPMALRAICACIFPI